ncbi:unnamed protein product [Amoebophrya sp. A120]|nr:unnamed protein product [Amoebophrya sp. A120]|eukprot:GSA120T00001234001.1
MNQNTMGTAMSNSNTTGNAANHAVPATTSSNSTSTTSSNKANVKKRLRTIKIRNMSGSKVVEQLVDPTKVRTVADLCNQDVILDAILAEEELRPPVHRLKWLYWRAGDEEECWENDNDAEQEEPYHDEDDLAVAMEGKSNQNITSSTGTSTRGTSAPDSLVPYEHDHPEAFLDPATEIDYYGDQAEEADDYDDQRDVAAASVNNNNKKRRKITRRSTTPYFQFVISAGEFDREKFLAGRPAEEVFKSGDAFGDQLQDVFENLTLEQGQSFLYDRSWEVIESLLLELKAHAGLKEYEEAKKYCPELLPETWLPFGGQAEQAESDETARDKIDELYNRKKQISVILAITTAIFSLPQREWAKHEKLFGGRYFAWEQRERYARRLRVQLFRHDDAAAFKWFDSMHSSESRRDADRKALVETQKEELCKLIFAVSNMDGMAAAEEIGVLFLTGLKKFDFFRGIYNGDGDCDLAFKMLVHNLERQSSCNEKNKDELLAFCKALDEKEFTKERIQLQAQAAVAHYADTCDYMWKRDGFFGASDVGGEEEEDDSDEEDENEDENNDITQHRTSTNAATSAVQPQTPVIESQSDQKKNYRANSLRLAELFDQHFADGLRALDHIVWRLIHPHLPRRAVPNKEHPRRRMNLVGTEFEDDPYLVYDFKPLKCRLEMIMEACEFKNDILHDLGVVDKFRAALEEKYGDEIPLPWSEVEQLWAQEDDEAVGGEDSFEDDVAEDDEDEILDG